MFLLLFLHNQVLFAFIFTPPGGFYFYLSFLKEPSNILALVAPFIDEVGKNLSII